MGVGCALAISAVSGRAGAQTLGANGELAAESAVVEGPGIKAGEGLLIHPSVGVETGFLSNVFFTDKDAEPSGILRLIAEMHMASLNEQRLATDGDESGEVEKGQFSFRAGLRVAYEEYLSSNDAVQAQRDVGIEADVRGIVFPQGTWVFAFSDEYARLNRPTNFESNTNIERDVNHLGLFLRFQPGGRALQGTLRYQNTIDYFERDTQHFANRMQHTFGLRAAWRWLPVTEFYADASLGIYNGLGEESEKVTSYPLRVVAGTQTAITVNTTISAEVGYGKGFYAERADYSGLLFGIEGGWRYSPFGRLKLLYRHEFADSINANFYRDHQIRAMIDQQIDRFTLSAELDTRFRKYEGLDPAISAMDTRSDLIISAKIGGQYHFREWLAATFDYHFTDDSTDFRYMNGTDPSYVRHEVYIGMMAAF
jgi:hypothetical protein